MTTHPFRVLVLCTGNSARSQVAEALLATRGAGRIVAASAGSHPATQVNPLAVELLRRHGIEWGGRTPKSTDQVTGREWDLLITVCDHANESCPYLPGMKARVHWGLPDPHTAADFEATWSALELRVSALLALPLESLASDELQHAAQQIHS
jgi:arsenate reductase